MRMMAAVYSGFSVLVLSHPAAAAVVSIHEYANSIVVEIDGSMDPKLANREHDGQASSTSVNRQSQAVEGKAGASQPARNNPPAGWTGAGSATPQASRGQQLLDYLAKMPKPGDFAEGRLEARRARWMKRPADALLKSTDDR